MNKIKARYKLNLEGFSYDEADLVEFMEVFGFYPDTNIYTGFFVKKIGDKRQESIFIDVLGQYTEKMGIVWNEVWRNNAEHDLSGFLLDFAEFGFIEVANE